MGSCKFFKILRWILGSCKKFRFGEGLGGGQLFMHADGVTKTLPTYGHHGLFIGGIRYVTLRFEATT